MKLTQALRHLGGVPVGLTSLIAAPSSVDTGAKDPQALTAAGVEAGLAHATEKVMLLKHERDVCGSDAAYWGYAGQVSYWEAVRNIFEAATLVGPDNLPDIPAPKNAGVVMDIMAQQERYGQSVLSSARRFASDNANPNEAKVHMVTIGGGDMDAAPPPGTTRAHVIMTGDDVNRIAPRIMESLNAIKETEQPAVVMACLMFVLGQVLAHEGIMFDPAAPVQEVLGPMMFGYSMAQKEQHH